MSAPISKFVAIVDSEGHPTQYFLSYLTRTVSTTIPLAKLTTGGTEGSLVFSNGLLVKVVQPT